MIRMFLALGASMFFASSAAAVTLEPGKTYLGEVTAITPQIEPTESFRYGAFSEPRAFAVEADFVGDQLDPGEELTKTSAWRADLGMLA